MDSALLKFGNAKKVCLFRLMRQNKNSPISFSMGGSGLDRTDDFQKFCRTGLDRIQFHQIRTGLGLKNFTVRSSLLSAITHKTT